MVKITKVCSGSGGILRDMVGVISSPRQVKKSLNVALNVTCKISSPLQEKISETDFPKYPLDLLMLGEASFTKNWFFSGFFRKGGGGSRRIQNFLNRKN